MEEYRAKIKKLIKKHIDSEIVLEIPPDASLGDFALPCFQFSKKLKKNPAEIASGLKANLKSDFIEKTEAKGPYLNFFIDRRAIARDTIKKVLAQKEGFGKIASKKEKVMVEFSQANTHKAFHVGHVRGTSLGESLARILEFTGKNVIRANYQGDTGMHVAKWLWCYKKFHSKEKIKKDESWFAHIYVDAVKRLSHNPELQQEVDEINQNLDSRKDEKLNKLWQKTRKLCLDSLEEIYKELNTGFDEYFFESELESPAKKISRELLDKKVAEVSDGATIVNLERYNLGIFLMLRKDGTVLYGGKDIALAARKFSKFKVNTSIYVVGKEQEHYLKQVFRVLELMKLKYSCIHVPVSLLKLPHGKMSSRTGDNILYSDFRKELVDFAKKEIKKRHRKLSEKELEKRALAIAIASMKYSMLKQNPNKEIIFNKEESVNFEGNTGPYLQYSYARASSIIRKGDKAGRLAIPELHEKEILLLKRIAELPSMVGKAASSLNPGIIANYSYKLAQDFNEFYTACKVIGSEEEAFRIRLVQAFRQALKNSLDLLGIDALERM
ncbi:arginine--tRNA ligase [Candidatus Woesearchaeota archaeon]|nr:arginine--tRNA ligase [Candidatus Woesearchaeota archaeon]